MTTKEEKEIKAALLAEAEEEEKAKAELEANESPEDKATREAEQARLQEGNIDYEAVAKIEKERREAAERLLAEDRYNASRQKRETEEERVAREEAEKEKPLTAKDLENFETRILQRTQKDSQEASALDIARKNTSSESEAQAALVFWKSRVVPTGNLEEDVKFAIGGLNSKKIVAKNAELLRALKAKEGVSNDSANTQFDGMPNAVPKLPTNSPLKDYKYMGKGIYALKLKSGKTLFRNAKAGPGEKKSWVE